MENTSIELDVGGSKFVTSVATLRSSEGSMLDALFSGRYAVDVCEAGEGVVFLDRDGEVFRHILAYLRDGVVGVGVEDDVVMLSRLKREFGYFCIDLYEEQEVAVVAGGLGFRDASNFSPRMTTVEKFDASRGRWTEMSPMAVARDSKGGACAIGNNVYVVGGLDLDGDTIITVERYCVSSDTWSSVADTPYAIYEHCVCAIGRCMYVIGGKNGEDERLRSVLKYDVDADSWSEVAPMPEARSAHAACVVGDVIYVVGGFGTALVYGTIPTPTMLVNTIISTRTLYKYDTSTDEWSTCESMPDYRELHSVCAMGGMLLVTGGSGFSDNILQYDTTKDIWTSMAAMENNRDEFGLFVLGDLMYAVDKQGMEVYDPVTNIWSAGQTMGVPRDCTAVCTVKISVNVFDAMMTRARRE
jgi:N-acetylneuraminic acid mutarotase